MSNIDYIVSKLKLTHKGKFDLSEFYKTLNKWFDVNGYSLLEKDYKDVLKPGTKDFSIRWESMKEVDDYTKFNINLTLTGSDIEKLDSKKGKIQSGEIKIVFESYLETDYEEKWERPVAKFIRGIYDKFIHTSSSSKYEKGLKEQTYDIFNKAKSFLGQEKFK